MIKCIAYVMSVISYIMRNLEELNFDVNCILEIVLLHITMQIYSQ